jgi:quercetin dioxygenase-like cupin family protein
VERWDLTSLPASTEKEHPREPGADAPRVPRHAGQFPRVLFSTPECRAVVIALAQGETMGDHHVRERAVVQVVSGRVAIEASGETADCGVGTLVTFAPSERHSVRAIDDSTLLLLLAPWPAPSHYTDRAEARDLQQLPANASVDPITPKSKG